jgi:hypothetical protein
MGIAKEIYDKMAINQEQPIVMTSGVGHADVYEPYERFKGVVEELERMEDAGLVSVTLRHNEQTTGRRYVDLVRFRKLK